MIQSTRRALRNTFVHGLVQRLRYGSLYCNSAANGNLAPPPYEIKRMIILLYAKLYQLTILIETGTYLGDTVDSVKSEFDQVYSIELDPVLYEQARKRFIGIENVCLFQGDSARLLPQLLEDIHAPCLFWLDAHYSGGNTARGQKDTPIIEELNQILSDYEDHVILIDDARLFTGLVDYPTLDQVKRLVLSRRPNYFIDVRHDIIRASKIPRNGRF